MDLEETALSLDDYRMELQCPGIWLTHSFLWHEAREAACSKDKYKSLKVSIAA
jgi:hypothetical protein